MKLDIYLYLHVTIQNLIHQWEMALSAGAAEYTDFIAIAPRSTLTQSGSTYLEIK